MLSHNLIKKSDQLMVYAFRFLNKVKHYYNTIEKDPLVMIFALHKFRHYLLIISLYFVDHMSLVYFVNKPHVLGKITRWSLLFLEYDFIIMYKLNKTHVITDGMLRLSNIIKPTCVPGQIIDAILFCTKPEWLNDVK
jgi:hypothetical protein